MSAKVKMAAYMVAIFLAGGVAGAILGATHGRHIFDAFPNRDEVVGRMKDRLENRVGLSPEQIHKIEPRIEQAADKLEAVHQQTVTQVSGIFREFHADITVAANLTDEQKSALAELAAEHRKRLNLEPAPTPVSQP